MDKLKGIFVIAIVVGAYFFLDHYGEGHSHTFIGTIAEWGRILFSILGIVLTVLLVGGPLGVGFFAIYSLCKGRSIPTVSLKIVDIEFPIYTVIVWVAIAMLWFVLLGGISLGEAYQPTIRFPYWVYGLLRGAVSIAALVLIVRGINAKHLWIPAVGLLVLFLFNPFMPIHLSKATWEWIDVATAMFFTLAQDDLNSKAIGEKTS